MAAARKCSKCGAQLKTDVRGGHCLPCMLRLGLAPEPAAALATGERVGNYLLHEKLGEGGYGIVFLAEQEEPVQRQVALKVIKPGMDTHEVLARFEAERQVLALLEHPNIPKVFDAGVTDLGHPFFVMELVRGVKITDYCDREKLSLRQRLKLFIPICQALQHAHQKGIIHRDLKPSNILITPCQVGAPAAPKIIDFGIAKSMEQRIKDQTTALLMHQFLGTPAYMSPEQAGLAGTEIDSRSDVYSLGVLLYELLAGRPPFDAAELRRLALDQVLHFIREADPPRPSERLTGLPPLQLATAASCRQVEPGSLRRLLRGDLDWIVMKCLEKEPARRYETPLGLAADLERHLANQPVQARPPAAIYRFKKLIRRNRLVFVATGVATAALAIGLGVSIGLFFQARIAERDSELVEAKLLTNLGAGLYEVGRLAEAETKYREALALHKKLADGDSPAVADALNNLAAVILSEGRPAEAETLNRQALETDRHFFGDQNRAVAIDMANLATALAAEKKFAEPENVDRETLALDRKLSGDKNPDVPVRLQALIRDLTAQSRQTEVEAVRREAEAVRTKNSK